MGGDSKIDASGSEGPGGASRSGGAQCTFVGMAGSTLGQKVPEDTPEPCIVRSVPLPDGDDSVPLLLQMRSFVRRFPGVRLVLTNEVASLELDADLALRGLALELENRLQGGAAVQKKKSLEGVLPKPNVASSRKPQSTLSSPPKDTLGYISGASSPSKPLETRSLGGGGGDGAASSGTELWWLLDGEDPFVRSSWRQRRFSLGQSGALCYQRGSGETRSLFNGHSVSALQIRPLRHDESCMRHALAFGGSNGEGEIWLSAEGLSTWAAFLPDVELLRISVSGDDSLGEELTQTLLEGQQLLSSSNRESNTRTNRDMEYGILVEEFARLEEECA